MNFRDMDPEKRRGISVKGGRAVHQLKRGHQWTAKTAAAAGRESARRRKRLRDAKQ